MSIKKDIQKLKEDQIILQEMIEMHYRSGIPPIEDLQYYLIQNQWNLSKLVYKVKKTKKMIREK